MTCKKTKPILTDAEHTARTRASIDVSFQNGHPFRAAEQRWFRCTHHLDCTLDACENLDIAFGEEAVCMKVEVDSLKNALQRRDFKCPDNRF